MFSNTPKNMRQNEVYLRKYESTLVVIKSEFWRISYRTLISRQLMEFTSKIKVDFKEQFWRIFKTTLTEKKIKQFWQINKTTLISSPPECLTCDFWRESENHFLEWWRCWLILFRINEFLQEVTQFQWEQSEALL